MKKVLEKWWDHDNKVFNINNYKESWKKHGNPPLFEFRTNGASKKAGDKCLDASLTIGYTVFNYTNFNLQGHKYWLENNKERESDSNDA